MYKIVKLIFLLIFPALLFGQNPKQWNILGEKALESGEYKKAEVSFYKAMELDPSSAEYTFKYAESLRLQNLYSLAETYYINSIRLDSVKSFPLSVFWLASMQKQQKKYSEAKASFSKFVKEYKNADAFFLRKAKNEIKSCDFAEKNFNDSILIAIKNLGENLNSEHAEFGVHVTGNNMLFSVLKANELDKDGNILDKDYSIKIYEAVNEEGEWQIKKPMPKIINNAAFDNANASLSMDKQRMYFSRCDAKGNCAIYLSVYSSNSWQNPVLMEAPVNIEGYNTTQPHITMIKGKEVLFFSSNRPGGKGGMDIWYTMVQDGGKTYSQPKNAGKNINTPDQEITPHFNIYNGCLYFSSNWHHGYGGFDIFKSCGDLKSFSYPENLGIPLNSSSNDLYPFFETEKKGYFTSNREGSYSINQSTCCNDIFSFEYLPEPEIVNNDSLKIEKALETLNKHKPILYFHNDEPNPKSNDTLTKINYMTSYEKYSEMLDIYKKEYSAGLNESQIQEAKDDIDDFFTYYVDKGVEELKTFTQLLKQELDKGAKFSITVKGYASPLAKSEYNVNLTLRRISSLINYLQEYEQGVLLPYINHTAQNGAKIVFNKIPFGEYKSDTTVSDNIHDKKNSIYSKKAALERKIEILAVDILSENTPIEQPEELRLTKTISISDTIVDFNKVLFGKEYLKKVVIKNNTPKSLPIKTFQADCSCTSVEWDKKDFMPNQEKEIIIHYKPNKTGKNEKQIIIYSEDGEPLGKINVKALVTKN